MSRPSLLEAELTALTRRFVSDIVALFRRASVADVAGLSWSDPPRKREAARKGSDGVDGQRTRGPGRRPRQSADKREELGERLVKVLQKASQPLGVRALSSELNVAADLLAAPIKDLRAAGRISKIGEKRNTRYTAA